MSGLRRSRTQMRRIILGLVSTLLACVTGTACHLLPGDCGTDVKGTVTASDGRVPEECKLTMFTTTGKRVFSSDVDSEIYTGVLILKRPQVYVWQVECGSHPGLRATVEKRADCGIELVDLGELVLSQPTQ